MSVGVNRDGIGSGQNSLWRKNGDIESEGAANVVGSVLLHVLGTGVRVAFAFALDSLAVGKRNERTGFAAGMAFQLPSPSPF